MGKMSIEERNILNHFQQYNWLLSHRDSSSLKWDCSLQNSNFPNLKIYVFKYNARNYVNVVVRYGVITDSKVLLNTTYSFFEKRNINEILFEYIFDHLL